MLSRVLQKLSNKDIMSAKSIVGAIPHAASVFYSYRTPHRRKRAAGLLNVHVCCSQIWVVSRWFDTCIKDVFIHGLNASGKQQNYKII